MSNSITWTQITNKINNKTKIYSVDRVSKVKEKYAHRLAQCKLALASDIKFQINKTHKELLIDYYLSDDPQHRIDIATQLVTDPSFVKHQTDRFHKHIDTGRLLKVDIDNYAASFDISYELAFAIAMSLIKNRIPKPWEVRRVNKKRRKDGEFRYYNYNFEIKVKEHQKITFQLANTSNSKNDSRQHCRISFCPNLVELESVEQFFSWMFNVFEDEKEHAVLNSMLLCNDLGIQWQGIVGFALNHDAYSNECSVYPKKALSEDVMVGSVYLLRGKDLGVDSDLMYCPVDKLLNKQIKRANSTNKRLLLENITFSTRYESRWRYQRGGDVYRYDELDKLPHAIEQVDFISPEIFSCLPEYLARKLVTQKMPIAFDSVARGERKLFVSSVNKHTHNIPKSKADALKQNAIGSFVEVIKRSEDSAAR